MLNSQSNSTPTTLPALMRVLADRREAAPDTSYVSSLYHAGPGRIREKIAEESQELIEATRNEGPTREAEIVHEGADLLFHTLVLLSWAGVTLEQIEAELSRRAGTSGLVEYEGRPPRPLR